MKKLHQVLLLHFVVVILGFTGILGKAIDTDAMSISTLRMFIGAAGLFVWLWIKREFKGLHKQYLHQYLLTGVVIAAHWITFFHSIKLSNVSVALVGISSSTLFISILEPIFYKRKIQFYELFLGLLIIIGLSIVFQVDIKYIDGLILAIISAFLASVFTVINGVFIQRNKNSAAMISAFELSGGFVVAGIFLWFLPHQSLSLAVVSLDGWDWCFLLILGLVCTSFAFTMTTEVMKTLSPYTVAMSINLEPIYSITLATLIFGKEEQMGLFFYLGGIIIIASVFLNGVWKGKKRSLV